MLQLSMENQDGRAQAIWTHMSNLPTMVGFTEELFRTEERWIGFNNQAQERERRGAQRKVWISYPFGSEVGVVYELRVEGKPKDGSKSEGWMEE